MKITLALPLLSLLVLVACSSATDVPMKEPSVDGNVGAACEAHTDCETPMSYQIRSSCPFTASCIDGFCAVTCPMFVENPNPSTGLNELASCSADADCDCGGYTSTGAAACRCVDGACMAVMKSDATR